MKNDIIIYLGINFEEFAVSIKSIDKTNLPEFIKVTDRVYFKDRLCFIRYINGNLMDKANINGDAKLTLRLITNNANDHIKIVINEK